MAQRWNQGKWGDGSHWLSAAEAAALELKGKTKMSKIKLSLLRMSIADVIVYLKKIVGKMTGNAKFNALAADVTALGTAVTTLETDNVNYEKSKSDTDTLMTTRDNSFATANQLAHALASGAEKITQDAADLQSGGWELVADRAPVGQLHPPANFHATGGDMSGSVDLGWDPQTGVQTHIVHWATAPAGPFTQGYVGKKSSCTITGLASGMEHWFRVQAVGAAGPSDWAGPISKRAT
jgi:hypothetical protein